MVMTFSFTKNIVGSTPTIGFTSTVRDLIRLLFGAVVEMANTSGFHPENSRFDPVQHHQASRVDTRRCWLFRSALAEKPQ